MVQLLRRISLVVLWALAAAGLACGVVWGATAAGVIQPLVVISGSMEPEIMTGDLLIATKAPADSLEVGDVVSLPSALTDSLVTHRITAIEPADGSYTITMKGDDNEFSDALDYHVSGEVWKPTVQLPGWGTVIVRMTTPAVAVPLFLGLLGLLGLTMMSPVERPVRRPATT
ncbi:signal peptidase I [Zhihengliuella sp. ISTPL4]|uniref:signal peptidase I n=1 Tax=Zhihengliuella sp. ISTPL4 TaxID=2058657 RepID=UPI002570F730|nr:signal peptidase I [Zhihengliuella sp. ISTPL4]